MKEPKEDGLEENKLNQLGQENEIEEPETLEPPLDTAMAPGEFKEVINLEVDNIKVNIGSHSLSANIISQTAYNIYSAIKNNGGIPKDTTPKYTG